jgi:hypothetical protein
MLNIPITHLYNTVLPITQEVESSLKLKKSKSGRKPKLSNSQINTLFIISYLTNCPVLRLAQLPIEPNIKSYHIFRKIRIKAVQAIQNPYAVKSHNHSSLMPVASLNRARTQKIRQSAGRQFWGKRKRKLYSKDYGKKVEFEEVYYGVLEMVVCDTEGTVYDLWYHPASYHEVKSLRKRVSKSVWLRRLLSRFELIGDRGYRGCDYVRVC